MDLRNNVNLIGNFGEAPDVKNTEKGKEMCVFSLATHYRKKNEGGQPENKTEWHDCVAFGGAAKLISAYMVKGSHVALNGSLRKRTYENKKGEAVKVTEIVVDTIVFLDKKDDRNG